MFSVAKPFRELRVLRGELRYSSIVIFAFENKAFATGNSPFSFENEVSLRRSEAFPVENMALLRWNEVFPVKNEPFPVRNEAFAVEDAVFPVANRAFPDRNEAIGLKKGKRIEKKAHRRSATVIRSYSDTVGKIYERENNKTQ